MKEQRRARAKVVSDLLEAEALTSPPASLRSARPLSNVGGRTNKIALTVNYRLRKNNSREETAQEGDFAEPVVGAGLQTRPYRPYQASELLLQAVRFFR